MNDDFFPHFVHPQSEQCPATCQNYIRLPIAKISTLLTVDSTVWCNKNPVPN